MFVEWRYIFLGWVLYDSYNTICLDYSIMYYLRAPSVAILGAVTEDCIAFLPFAHKHAIPHHNGIHRANNAIQCYTILHSPQGV